MATPEELRELSSDLVVHAVRLVRAVRRALEQPAGMRVLSLLDQYGALGVTQLAAADRSSQPTMSGAIAGLVERGWVDKQPNPADARSSVVTLTDAGRAELHRIRRMNGEFVAARLAAAPHPHSLEDLATAVAVLRDVLDAGPEPNPGSSTGASPASSPESSHESSPGPLPGSSTEKGTP
ncbi:MarR family winged helix-turn-helix transcriptional regulator [Nocardioides panaciterrulae]|uniref:DNA-binding MarR family transcriptional regulator n=1 Tax=Nocardioides panaciterrulae TaxID=661492 RepID=A0A7Y9E7M7_9ACTN|nr:MarR family winged helix-turn-helix transcriptional regulator [Nocardioides panaciterrulae]NYD42716.1 DNA-binding MarR family transcriptional regulator [Nocardioides panaciterrulae]